jgi:hypothetical protein
MLRTEMAGVKLTERERLALDFLKAKRRRTISDLIRDALLDAYDIEGLADEAVSFFGLDAQKYERQDQISEPVA